MQKHKATEAGQEPEVKQIMVVERGQRRGRIFDGWAWRKAIETFLLLSWSGKWQGEPCLFFLFKGADIIALTGPIAYLSLDGDPKYSRTSTGDRYLMRRSPEYRDAYPIKPPVENPFWSTERLTIEQGTGRPTIEGALARFCRDHKLRAVRISFGGACWVTLGQKRNRLYAYFD